MSFARIVFRVAGIWGFVVLTPILFMYDRIGQQYPPPITHPDFFYGFLGTALVWQVAFLVISTDPVRFRPMMIAAMLEKFVYMATLVLLLMNGRLEPGQFAVASPDLLLGFLFVAAYVKTPRAIA
jgi:hypothetical protein